MHSSIPMLFLLWHPIYIVYRGNSSENCSFIRFTEAPLAMLYQHAQIEDEMGGTCSTHDIYEKCIQYVGWKS